MFAPISLCSALNKNEVWEHTAFIFIASTTRFMDMLKKYKKALCKRGLQ